MKTDITFGIIGCGKQASKHLRALQHIAGCTCILADVDPLLAQGMAADAGCEWVEHPDQLFSHRRCDAALICTPTQTHVPLIHKALSTGMHVFCEKPVADDLTEIEGLRDVVGKSNYIVTAGYIYRHAPVFKKGFALFGNDADSPENCVMGRPLIAFFRLGGRGEHRTWKHRRATGGGAVNEMLVHMVDLANWYFGPLYEVMVVSTGLHLPQRYIGGKLISADAEDFVMVRCRGRAGVEIYLQGDLLTPAFSQFVEIQAENGSFRGSIQLHSPCYLHLKEARCGHDAGRTDLSAVSCDLIGAQMQAFVSAIMEGPSQRLSSIEDSYQINRIIQQIKNQMEI